MNQFVNLALVLFASVAAVECGLYGALPPAPQPAPAYGGPAVHQVNLASLGSLANLANSYLNAPSSGASYGSAPSWAPAKYVVAPSATAHGPASASSHSAAPAAVQSAGYGAIAAPSAGHWAVAAPSAGYGAIAAPSAGYGAAAAPSTGYGAAPKFSVLPAYVSQINPGKQSYKSYQSPIQYSTVALPIVPSEPVAKLFVPEQSSYGSSSQSYGAPSISVGSNY